MGYSASSRRGEPAPSGNGAARARRPVATSFTAAGPASGIFTRHPEQMRRRHPARRQAARRVREAIESHLGSKQVTRVVYGAIIGLAFIVAIEHHPPAAGVMVGWLLATAMAVALAEVYAEVVGIETRERHRVTRHQVTELLDDAVAVGFGVAFPAVFFLLAAVGAMQLDTAFALAKWSGLGLIGFYGFCAARLAGSSVVRALMQGVFVAAIGGAVIAFKAVVH